jgi:hypothetical protein
MMMQTPRCRKKSSRYGKEHHHAQLFVTSAQLSAVSYKTIFACCSLATSHQRRRRQKSISTPDETGRASVSENGDDVDEFVFTHASG